MGRREEPKLDELKKLLRRLETIESAPRKEGVALAAPQAATPGYVGALRGAPATAVSEEMPQRLWEAESRIPSSVRGVAPDAEQRPRTMGLGAIIIGAATAAIVSSMIALALAPRIVAQDKASPQSAPITGAAAERSADPPPVGRSDRRAVAPAASETRSFAPQQLPKDETLVPRAPAPARLPPQSAAGATAPDKIEAVLEHADALIGAGNMEEARRVLEQASSRGSGLAALMLGATYDPARTGQFANAGANPDVALARAWYERARALGTDEAASRLTELAKR